MLDAFRGLGACLLSGRPEKSRSPSRVRKHASMHSAPTPTNRPATDRRADTLAGIFRNAASAGRGGPSPSSPRVLSEKKPPPRVHPSGSGDSPKKPGDRSIARDLQDDIGFRIMGREARRPQSGVVEVARDPSNCRNQTSAQAILQNSVEYGFFPARNS